MGGGCAQLKWISGFRAVFFIRVPVVSKYVRLRLKDKTMLLRYDVLWTRMKTQKSKRWQDGAQPLFQRRQYANLIIFISNCCRDSDV